MTMGGVDSLPNEILIQIFSLFSARETLCLAPVSRRFYGVVGRLHYSRVVEASSLRGHELVLECYHPSVKISTPTLFCEHLGTDGLADAGAGDVDLGRVRALYSRFRLSLGEDSGSRRPRARNPTRAVQSGAEEALAAEPPSHDLHLDADEPFSQLCTVASLIKIGARRDVFLSITNVVDGVVRVWRQWLRDAASPSSPTPSPPAGASGEHLLWVSSAEDVGLVFRVRESDSARGPVLIEADEEEPPASYTLEFQELRIRTNQLVLALETSLAHQVSQVGKALVIATM